MAACRQAVADLVGGDPRRRRPRPQHDDAHLPPGRPHWRPAGRRATRSCCPGSTTTPTSGRGCRSPARAGATVRWAEVDLATGELPAEQYDGLVGPAHPAGRGHRRQQHARHPARRRRDHGAGARGRRARPTSTACTRPRTGRSTSPRSAPTSTPPARTSGRARTSARSSPIRRCWRRCGPDKLLPAPDDVPERFETGHGRRSPTWPG